MVGHGGSAHIDLASVERLPTISGVPPCLVELVPGQVIALPGITVDDSLTRR